MGGGPAAQAHLEAQPGRKYLNHDREPPTRCGRGTPSACRMRGTHPGPLARLAEALTMKPYPPIRRRGPEPQLGARRSDNQIDGEIAHIWAAPDCNVSVSYSSNFRGVT